MFSSHKVNWYFSTKIIWSNEKGIFFGNFFFSCFLNCLQDSKIFVDFFFCERINPKNVENVYFSWFVSIAFLFFKKISLQAIDNFFNDTIKDNKIYIKNIFYILSSFRLIRKMKFFFFLNNFLFIWRHSSSAGIIISFFFAFVWIKWILDLDFIIYCL